MFLPNYYDLPDMIDANTSMSIFTICIAFLTNLISVHLLNLFIYYEIMWVPCRHAKDVKKGNIIDWSTNGLFGEDTRQSNLPFHDISSRFLHAEINENRISSNFRFKYNIFLTRLTLEMFIRIIKPQNEHVHEVKYIVRSYVGYVGKGANMFGISMRSLETTRKIQWTVLNHT